MNQYKGQRSDLIAHAHCECVLALRLRAHATVIMAETPKLAVPKKAKSPLWAYFGFEENEEGKRVNDKQVHCKLCHEAEQHEKAAIAFSGNTTNLRQHLIKWHPEIAQSASRATSGAAPVRQPTMEEFSSRPVRKLAATSKRAKEITRCLAEFIARDMRPVSIVEGKGFMKLGPSL